MTMTPVTEILSQAQIDALMSGYAQNPAALANFARTTFSEMYPPGTKVFNSFVDHFNTHSDNVEPLNDGALSAHDREIAIIAVLTAVNVPNAAAIHFYWGLCVGVTVTEIAEVLLLTAGYSGTQNYTNGLTLLSSTLTKLKTLFTGPGPYKPVDPIAGMGALK